MNEIKILVEAMIEKEFNGKLSEEKIIKLLAIRDNQDNPPEERHNLIKKSKEFPKKKIWGRLK